MHKRLKLSMHISEEVPIKTLINIQSPEKLRLMTGLGFVTTFWKRPTPNRAKMRDISVFGSSGFIGGNFCKLYEAESLKIPREQRMPDSEEILYLISTTHNYNVFDDPHLDINTNLNLLLETLEECKKKENITFNFVSSWFVYGETEDLPASEDSPCNPRGFYSITKRAAEQLLISYCKTFDINYRIFRLCNVYGTGDGKVSIKKNALQYLINEVVHGRDINLYDGGENIRDFMHVDDVCRAMHFCINNSKTNQIINIGSGIPYKFGEIMSYVKVKTNSSSTFNSIDPPKFHKTVQVKDMYLDVTKLKNLGFEQTKNFWYQIDEIIHGSDEADQ